MELPLFDGFMRGQPGWLETLHSVQGDKVEGLSGAVRLFPHRLEGEGHFACLIRRISGTDIRMDETDFRADQLARLTRARLGFWREFAAEVLSVDLAEDRLRVVGERLYYVPEQVPNFGRLRVIHPGVWLGSFKKERFEPAHPLATFLKPGEAKNFVSFDAGSRELAAYLRGESIESDARGWAVVCVNGWPLGWGKGVQGTLKNHFPRGWMV
jgi:NOL1/NOP2/fmu family ribosome biogenesis protein